MLVITQHKLPITWGRSNRYFLWEKQSICISKWRTSPCRYADPAQFDALTGFDVVFDTVGNKTILEMAIPLSTGGKLVTITNHNLAQEDIDLLKTRGIEASSLLVESSGSDMAKIANLLQQGILKSYVSQTFDFEDLGSAHKQLETGRTVGKIVVNI